MKDIVLRLWIAACLLALPCCRAAACTLAITNVAVVPMDREAAPADQTVIVDGGRIAAVGPSSAARTNGCATIINGRGKFVLPGLIDTHVHVESLAFAQAFGVKQKPIVFEDVLVLYPAYGVTSVRVMSGSPDILAFRDRQTQAPVPRLVVASPMLAGNPPILPPPATLVVETEEQARAAVRGFARDGYDLIKLRENLKADVFRAVVSQAKGLGVFVDGHVTRGTELTVPDLIREGQNGFAHLDEIARAMAADGARRREEIIALLKELHVTISTTMIVLQSAIDQMTDYERLAARPQARFLHPLLTQTFWTRAQNPYLKPGVDREFFVALLKETKSALKRLTDEGVRIMAGTDALNPMIIPGVSLHEELQLMVDAGLTPYQALKTATVNPASALQRLSNAGVIAAGRDADLVLLGADPLADIRATLAVEGVVIGGCWFDRKALDDRLEQVAAKYRKP